MHVSDRLFAGTCVHSDFSVYIPGFVDTHAYTHAHVQTCTNLWRLLQHMGDKDNVSDLLTPFYIPNIEWTVWFQYILLRYCSYTQVTAKDVCVIQTKTCTYKLAIVRRQSVPICRPLIVILICFFFINFILCMSDYCCQTHSILFSRHFTHPFNALKVSSPLFRIATDDDSCIDGEKFGSNLLLASEVKWQLCMKHSIVVQGNTYTYNSLNTKRKRVEDQESCPDKAAILLT